MNKSKKLTPSTKEQCLADALKFKTRTEWHKNSIMAYRYAKLNGYFEECVSHMPKDVSQRPVPTKEQCLADALKFNTRTEWRKNSARVLKYAKQYGCFEECVFHMLKRESQIPIPTKEQCLADALEFKTRTEWHKNSSMAYSYAKLNGYFEECVSHMPKNVNQQPAPTKDQCLEDALRFKKRSEWQRGSPRMYGQARNGGYFEECVAHMKTKARKIHSEFPAPQKN